MPAAADRNLYTYTGTYSDTGVPVTPALTAATNALKDSTSDSALTAAMLGLGNTADSDDVINATRESKLNDPLHSKPALVTYGGTKEAPEMTLFVADAM